MTATIQVRVTQRRSKWERTTVTLRMSADEATLLISYAKDGVWAALQRMNPKHLGAKSATQLHSVLSAIDDLLCDPDTHTYGARETFSETDAPEESS